MHFQAPPLIEFVFKSQANLGLPQRSRFNFQTFHFCEVYIFESSLHRERNFNFALPGLWGPASGTALGSSNPGRASNSSLPYAFCWSFQADGLDLPVPLLQAQFKVRTTRTPVLNTQSIGIQGKPVSVGTQKLHQTLGRYQGNA